jgi:hypothetical protein
VHAGVSRTEKYWGRVDDFFENGLYNQAKKTKIFHG